MEEVSIKDAPTCLNINDRAMWVTGYNEAVKAMRCQGCDVPKDGLHQIAEPAAPLVSQQEVQPYAVLVFERGEEGPFDRKPVKPDSAQHLHAKRDPHYDYIELYTHPTQQGLDAVRELIAMHSKELEQNPYAYFELAHTRQTGWCAWVTDHPRSMPPAPVINPDRKVIAMGQGETPDAACEAALAAQAKQGEQANG